MNKIIIMSDTHGNQQMLRKALSNEDYTHIFHLGDNYNDLDNNFDLTDGKTMIRVPGIYHPGYQDMSIPAAQYHSVNGWNFCLIHDIGIVKKKFKTNTIYFHGHTHQIEFYERNNNVVTINPGHLKNFFDRGQKPSYITAEVDEQAIRLDFKGLSGNIFGTKMISKENT
jgi:predicted phosphodiesterase